MTRRVFLGLIEVAGYFSNLERGFLELGTDARLHDLSANPLGYGRAGVAESHRRRARLLTWADAEPGSIRRRLWGLALKMSRIARSVRALALLPFALARYNSFVLAGGGMFLGGRELWLMRALRKRVIVVFTGSDHRPPYLNGIWVREAQTVGYRTIARDARRIRDRVRRAEKWADVVVALPASAQFHQRDFVNVTAIGFPFSGSASTPRDRHASSPTDPADAVIVLHAPTNPASKGSAEIRAAIKSLQAKGIMITYKEIRGRPHAEVIEAIQACDLVVDEVYSDAPMAAFATEAAFYGKPVVVTGYFAPHLHEVLAPPQVPPTLFKLPSDLTSSIELLVNDIDLRTDLGQRARTFVTTKWSPRGVAGRFSRLLDGPPPSEWVVKPGTVEYIHGWGMPEDLLRVGLRGLIERHGAAALAVDDIPTLRAKLIEMAK